MVVGCHNRLSVTKGFVKQSISLTENRKLITIPLRAIFDEAKQ